MSCPTVDLRQPYNNTGWRKLVLWKNELPGMKGDWLFLDLDAIVMMSLDVFFEFEPDVSFVVMQSRTQPGKGVGNISVFRFRVGAHPYIFDRLESEFESIHDNYRIEQTWISRTVNEMKFCPDEWCTLLKAHCAPPMLARWWKVLTAPVGTSLRMNQVEQTGS